MTSSKLGNLSNTKVASTGSKDTSEPNTAKRRPHAEALGDIVQILSTSSRFKHNSLADIEWMIMPAIRNGQFVIAHAHNKETGATVPAAVVLWAALSKERATELRQGLTPGARIRPDEWKSGPVVCIAIAEGEPRVVSSLLEKFKSMGNLKTKTDSTQPQGGLPQN